MLTYLRAQIIEEILLELYAGKRKPNGDLSLRRYTSMLESWRENLHPDLVIPPDAVVSPPPNRITLSYVCEVAFSRTALTCPFFAACSTKLQ